MKLRDQYDWIVLGDHPAALLSAALVARLGLTVLVLDLVPRAKVLVAPGSLCLDPETNFVLGLASSEGESGLLGECLLKLGASAQEMAKCRGEDWGPELLTPQKRVSLKAQHSEFERELSREFGKNRPDVAALAKVLKQVGANLVPFWGRLPERLTLRPEKRNRPAARAKSQKPEGLPDRKALGALGAHKELMGLIRDFASAIAPESPANDDPLQALSVLELARTASGYPGGVSAFREFLKRLAIKHGAHCPSDGVARTVFIHDGRLVGIQTSLKNTVISATGAVLGCSVEHALPRLSLSGRKWFHRLKPAPKPASWKFTVALSVQAEAIPEEARSRVIWKEEGAPPLEIEVALPSDYGVSEPEHRFVFLRTELPFDDAAVKLDYLRTVASRMFRQAVQVFPYLEFHVIRMFPDFRSDDFHEVVRVFDFDSAHMIPLNLRARLSNGIGSRSGIEGLFVASDEAFPELGSLGGTVAALESAAWIAHLRGIAGPLA